MSSEIPEDAVRLSPRKGDSRRIRLLLGVGVGVILTLLVILLWLKAPADPYQYGTPPVGPNARPDPPNPDKIKRLPGADG
jgi:hypothetical protein